MNIAALKIIKVLRIINTLKIMNALRITDKTNERRQTSGHSLITFLNSKDKNY